MFKIKSLNKNFLREIRYSFARFLSIMLIVALGVAFFAGIESAAPAMRASADTTYDNEKFMDICVTGTLGVTERDVAEISKLADVSVAEGVYNADFLCSTKDAEVVTSVLSLTDRVNLVKVVEGRYPVSYDECIADARFLEKTGYRPGDKITLATGNGEELSDTLATDTFLIVGVGTTAYYLSDDRGTTDIGSGVVDAFIIVPKEAFSMSTFTRIFVKVSGADELNCFSSRYEKKIENVKNNINTIAKDRCTIRFEEFKSESAQLIETAQKRFEDQKQGALNQYEQAYQVISDSQSSLDLAQAELDSYKEEVEDAKDLLNSNEEMLPKRQEDLEQARRVLAEQEALYYTTKRQLDDNQEIIAKMEDELYSNARSMSAEEFREAADTIYNWKETGRFYQSQLEIIKMTINQAHKRIDNAQMIIDGSPEAIADAREKLATGEEKIKQAQRELNDKQASLDIARQEYELAKQDMVDELNDAQDKLDNYKAEIEATPIPVWYVTGREVVDTYSSFDRDADGISAIGAVFPIIFYLVAALVSLTTMTRMVEEQKTQIGTFKALGYSKSKITEKYLMYALAATLTGAVTGAVAGELIIPPTVVETYKLMYVNMALTVVPINIPYALLAIAISIVCTTGAAYIASRRSLKEMPSSLLRVNAPSVGKTIKLEKLKFFWMRLNFAQKVALRNMFRYKKRLFMTVFGVAGCMALLLVGFGIRDSVSSITEKQFGTVWNYQGTVTINEGITRTQRRHLLSALQSMPGVEDYLQVHRSPSVAVNGEKEQGVYIVVPQNPQFLNSYIKLSSRDGKSEYALNDESVIITEKLAKLLGVSQGDVIRFKTDNTASPTVEITVSGVVENYLYHYVYMSPAVYRSLFGESPNLNTLFLRSAAANNDVLAKEILKADGVTSVTMNSSLQEDFNKTVNRLMVIVLLMIGSAALLAFVVLYNLNNINITERKRELATLKVLGFYPKEIRKYVFRENILMSIIGIVIGTAFGLLLHYFVMMSVETDTMMFGREIKWYSFAFGIGLTSVFSAIVNFIMSFKLKKIDMIESTKSNE